MKNNLRARSFPMGRRQSSLQDDEDMEIPWGVENLITLLIKTYSLVKPNLFVGVKIDIYSHSTSMNQKTDPFIHGIS
jgi:hypothetical protein